MINITGDRVAIIPIHEADTTGEQYADPSLPVVKLWVPDEAKKRTVQGLVKYVGPQCKYVRPGMYVAYSQYSGTLTEIEGEGKLIIMSEDFIVAELLAEPVTIPGLFFQARVTPQKQIDMLMSTIKQAIDLPDDMLKHVAQHLYLNGYASFPETLLPATYEKVMELSAHEFTRQGMVKQIETPKLRDEDWEAKKV